MTRTLRTFDIDTVTNVRRVRLTRSVNPWCCSSGGPGYETVQVSPECSSVSSSSVPTCERACSSESASSAP
jgi:hypothetical protein